MTDTTQTPDAPKPGFVDKLKDFVVNKMLGTAWDKLDGAKTYLAGAAAILGGAAGLATEVNALIATHSPSAVWAFAQHLSSDPAYLLLVGGLATVGIAHKADKAIEAQQIVTNAQDPAPEAGK